MSFSITLDLDGPPFPLFDEQCINGRITIGAFSEKLTLPVEFWAIEDYLNQWEEGLDRIVKGDVVVSCLVTAMRDPSLSGFVNVWPIYREGDLAIFQNQILMNKSIRSQYGQKTIYDFIEPHESMSEDGEPISEWEVPVEYLKQFLCKNER